MSEREQERSYDPSQPGLETGLARIAETHRYGEVHVVPGLGYTLLEHPAFPDHFVNLQLDGIGSKAQLHERVGTPYAAAQDALAMVLNDALLVKGEAIALGDTLKVTDDDARQKELLLGAFARESATTGLPVIGGETAVMRDDPYFSLDGAAIVLVPKPETGSVAEYVRTLNRFRPGDVVIGLPSNGIHANGVTEARRVLEGAGQLEAHLAELTRPTYVYYDRVRKVYRDIGGMMHLSGDAFRKPAKVLPPDADLIIDDLPEPQAIFQAIREAGTFTNAEMLTMFNCGTGFLLSVAPEREAEVLESLNRSPQRPARRIGRIEPGTGRTRIRGPWGGRAVVFEPGV
jgi:phosphoribosylformylglycinamidine cyclo-ligase